MITTILNGGLGNQLFQIAVAYALAKDNNDTCAFNLDAEVVHQGNSATNYRNNLYSKLEVLPKGWKPGCVYKEPRFNYKRIPYRENLQLEGYFQSQRYFNRYKSEILDLFLNDDTVYNVLSGLYKKYYKYLCGQSVSIHVRRGDYIKFKDVHTNLGLDYYKEALRRIGRKVEIGYVLVFSDDIEWCKENIVGQSCVYVEGLKDYEDLILMSLCKHNIIANSSFSWWAMYFNRNPRKIVCATKAWFGSAFEGDWNNIYTKKKMIVL